jgi:hypothetical protein
LFTERIFAHKSRAKKGKGHAGFGEVDQNIVRSAAGSLRLTADVAKLLRLGIDIDQFDLIDDPIAACEQAATAIRTHSFHLDSTAVGAFSELKEMTLWQAIFVGFALQRGQNRRGNSPFSEELLFNTRCYS